MPEQELPSDSGTQPDSEMHHFQLIGPDGQIPLSISVLVRSHAHQRESKSTLPPLTADDVLKLHTALENFNGDFSTAFRRSKSK